MHTTLRYDTVQGCFKTVEAVARTQCLCEVESLKYSSSLRMTQCENEGNLGIKEQRWANCCFARRFKKGDKRNLLGNNAFDSFSRSEFLTSMLMKILFFWDAKPCMNDSYLREF